MSRPMPPLCPPAGAAWIMLMRIGGVDMESCDFPSDKEDHCDNGSPPDCLPQ